MRKTMRSIVLALAASMVCSATVRAGTDPRFEDAALHAVQFVDREEGWAAGDEGVIWHTIDGGANWERQPSGVRASLRSVHFLNPYTGWIAGREELPHGAGSVGVLLFTQDGGLKWRRLADATLPGLNAIRFADNHHGYAAGDGNAQFCTGLFATADGGHTWNPVSGPCCPSWRAIDLLKDKTYILAGSWGRLANLRGGKLEAAQVEIPGSRTIYGIRAQAESAIAVGAGGIVLRNADAGAASWEIVNLPISAEVRADWDFHAVCCLAEHVWIVGRPGTRVLHSGDRGGHWEILSSGQPLPLNSVNFIDERRGWAVGELGSILNTADGGQSWHVQRRGGQRVAIAFMHSRPTSIPLDAVALLGGRDSYLAVGMSMTDVDPGSAALVHAGDRERLTAAMRRAGGAAGEVLWQFPVPQHQAECDRHDILSYWDRLHGDQSAQQLLRQAVLALRIWQPDVVVIDDPDRAHASSYEGIAAEAVREAFRRTGKASEFPEQVKDLGLAPWQPSKLYARSDNQAGAQVVLDLDQFDDHLGDYPRAYAVPAAALISETPPFLPAVRSFRLLECRREGIVEHGNLMDGIVLAPAGVARRQSPPLRPVDQAAIAAARTRRNLEALVEKGPGALAQPDTLLAQIAPILRTLPDDQGAAAAFAAASRYAHKGEWSYARELYTLMADRYPAHPLAADADRWLIRHNASSEAKRRFELGQFQVVSQSQTHDASSETPAAAQSPLIHLQGNTQTVKDQQITLLQNRTESRRWFQASLDRAPRLAAFGPLFAGELGTQFCLQAAERGLGDSQAARERCRRFQERHADGPWAEATAAELWLQNRQGAPPKPLATCRFVSTRPFLDGNLDEECWREQTPLVLRDAVGASAADNQTEVWLAFDDAFLYLAARCRHPEATPATLARSRAHDADLRGRDRISLLLDLDRDYLTYFRLDVDERGCVREDCSGDTTWDPRWFVAVQSDQTSWRVEAAIPLTELTGDRPRAGQVWACNLVRVLPGRGVQAFSVPADVEPRPEGMGLLQFTGEAQSAKANGKPAKTTGQAEKPKMTKKPSDDANRQPIEDELEPPK
jgi:photosystem II stability/assembly factor-like uncharacterized protein